MLLLHMVVKYLWSNNSVCEKFEKQKKPFNTLKGFFCLLSHQDSNLDRQNQKLQCYHYTMRQSFVAWGVPKIDANIAEYLITAKF